MDPIETDERDPCFNDDMDPDQYIACLEERIKELEATTACFGTIIQKVQGERNNAYRDEEVALRSLHRARHHIDELEAVLGELASVQVRTDCSYAGSHIMHYVESARDILAKHREPTPCPK